MSTSKENIDDEILKIFGAYLLEGRWVVSPETVVEEIKSIFASELMALVGEMEKLPERGFGVPQVGTPDHAKGTFTKHVSSQEVVSIIKAKAEGWQK